MSNKSSIKNQKYLDDWLKDPLFKDWLKKEDKSTKRARCTICHKTFELSSAGRSAVVDRGKGQKRNDALKKVLNFFKKSLSLKQTTIEGADTVEVESDNQVPTCRYCFHKGWNYLDTKISH